MFRYLRRFPLLVVMSSGASAPRTVSAAIALLFSICSIVPEGALAQSAIGIATPTNKQKGCLDNRSLKLGINSPGTYMLFDGSDDSINLRSKPSVQSSVQGVVASRTPVVIKQQVSGKDGYCWLEVQLTTYDVTGWVRGDLISIVSAKSRQSKSTTIELRTGSPYESIVANYYRSDFQPSEEHLKNTFYPTAAIDLNGDGIDEVIGQVTGGSNCGTAGCIIYVFEKKKGKWQPIGDLFGNTIALGSSTTKGYRDLLIYGWKGRQALVQFDGKQYSLAR
ncbi:SH3 domain-containing protein [Calothrix sp. NIES-2100]|uniref:SH3 domain-containing protein n=1 Tax=Calothrix sp. NIES-2100 TaxID=1954172 RepID=UPI0030DC9B05